LLSLLSQVWQAAFLVVLADYLLRFFGLMPKLLVVFAMQYWAVPGNKTQRRQARVLTLMEHLLGGYRALVPIPIW
jgi:hypothetical protein